MLLRQASPDWDEVLALYAERARLLLIFNQQWTAPGGTVRLVDLGEKRFFEEVPHDRSGFYAEAWDSMDKVIPKTGKFYRDSTRIFQWGITDEDLIRVAKDLGYQLRYFRDHGRFMNSRHFENHAFLFAKPR